MKHFGHKGFDNELLTFDDTIKNITEVSFDTCDGFDEENDEDNLENRGYIKFPEFATEKEVILAVEKFFNEPADKEYLEKRKPFIYHKIKIDKLSKPILKGDIIHTFRFELERTIPHVPEDRFSFDRFE